VIRAYVKIDETAPSAAWAAGPVRRLIYHGTRGAKFRVDLEALLSGRVIAIEAGYTVRGLLLDELRAAHHFEARRGGGELMSIFVLLSGGPCAKTREGES
jgi:hypothetical protein